MAQCRLGTLAAEPHSFLFVSVFNIIIGRILPVAGAFFFFYALLIHVEITAILHIHIHFELFGLDR